jgi:microcystin-dependent protein
MITKEVELSHVDYDLLAACSETFDGVVGPQGEDGARGVPGATPVVAFLKDVSYPILPFTPMLIFTNSGVYLPPAQATTIEGESALTSLLTSDVFVALPKGDKGDDGEKGDKGDKGESIVGPQGPGAPPFKIIDRTTYEADIASDSDKYGIKQGEPFICFDSGGFTVCPCASKDILSGWDLSIEIGSRATHELPKGEKGDQGEKGVQGEPGSSTIDESFLVPPGVPLPWFSPIAPPNYTFLDGGELSRNDNPKLFAAWGTMFGAGNSVTTFNKPDLSNSCLTTSQSHSDLWKVGMYQVAGASHAHSVSGRTSTAGNIFYWEPYSNPGSGGSSGSKATTKSHSHTVSGSTSAVVVPGETRFGIYMIVRLG